MLALTRTAIGSSPRVGAPRVRARAAPVATAPPTALPRRRTSTTSTRTRTRAAVVAAAAGAGAGAAAAASAAIPQIAAAKKAAAATVVAATPTLAYTLSTVVGSNLAFPALWALTALPCCLAFINPVYVFSVGYGLAVAYAGAGLLALASLAGMTIPKLVAYHCVGAVVYGVRLAAFLAWRSVTWDQWGKRAEKAPEARAKSLAARVPVVLCCSLLYACMCSPMVFHVKVAHAIGAEYGRVVGFGLAVQWCGLLLEALADHTKSAYKMSEEGKNRWCDVGVYQRCRHPNYLGEVLFWVGLYVAGAPAMLVYGAVSFAPATLGLVFIVWLMTSQCAKQDEKQAERYGENPEYNAWVANSGSLTIK